MKKILLFLSLIPILSFSQYSEQEGHLWVKYSHGIVDTAQYNNFSLGGEWLVTNRIGLNYNLDFVFQNNRIFQAHSSMGVILGPPLIGLGFVSWLASSDNDGDGKKDANFGALGIIGGILLIALPEGVSYHIPLHYNWDLAPYANILGVNYLKNNNTDKHYFRYCGTFGTKLTYWQTNKYTLSGFAEARWVSGLGWSYGGGAGIGYTIGKKPPKGYE